MSRLKQSMLWRPLRILSITLFLLAPGLPAAFAQDSARPDGWTDSSHGNRVPADYDLVLPDDRINEIYITFTPESWAAEEADMIEIYGERGTGEGGGFGRQFQPDFADLAARLDRSEEAVQAAFALLPDFAAAAERLEMETDELVDALGLESGFRPPDRADGPPRGGQDGRQGGGGLDQRNPIYVPVTIQFGDQTWWEVGFRYKGQSTLMTGWRSGAMSLPIKLDFDEFEDDYPELENQRFYGFKQLTFTRSPSFDPSLQREKVVADIFRAAGVPAPETAFYAVYVDNGLGDGFKYWGVYTAIELPEDTLIESQFESDDGNVYKPEGAGADFVADTFTEAAFDKESNPDSGYDDVLALFDALHDPSRLTDPVSWRARLEAVFHVDGFLRWLAANTLMQNWNTYGSGPGNYYLYADPSIGKLVWIPWDNNTALQTNDGRRPPPDLPLETVDPDDWPLIGNLLADELYAGRYVEHVADVSERVFTPDIVIPMLEANFDMLAAYMAPAESAESVAALRAAADELVAHVHERAAAAEAFLLAQIAE